MTTVGLIGCGGIAQDVLAALRASAGQCAVRIVGALARPGARGRGARTASTGSTIVDTLDDSYWRVSPRLIAEVAGQSAVAEHGERVLRAGIDLLVISVGALADPALLARLESAAADGRAASCCRPAPSAASTRSRR